MADGYLETGSKTLDTDVQSINFEVFSETYDSGDVIDVDIIASPGSADEEILTVDATEVESTELNWSTSHNTFKLKFYLDAGSFTSPEVYYAALKFGKRLVWSVKSDWDNSTTDGLVYENVSNTDHTNENTIKRGYSISDPRPNTPYIYWPMHEDLGNTVYDFGSLNNNGVSDSSVSKGQEGVIDTTSYKFSEFTYAKVGTLQKLYNFETGNFNNWDDTKNISINTDRVYSGSYSAYCGNPSSPYQAVTTPFPGGYRASSVEFVWQETNSSTGGGLQLINSNGNPEFAITTDNPEWDIVDGNGSQQVYGGSNYDDWTRFIVNIDWQAGSFSYNFENLEAGDTQSGSGRPLINGTDIEKLRIVEYSSGTILSGNDINMWFDDIIIQ